MEEMPVDSIARIDSCGHIFCCECLRGHVTAVVAQHRFPILCPTCAANKSKEKPGGTCHLHGSVGLSRYLSLEVSLSLALNLGLTDEQLSMWTDTVANPGAPSPWGSTILSLTPSYPPVHLQPSQTAAPPDIDSLSYAMRLQREFDEEDRALSEQRTELANPAQLLLECCSCMDKMLADSIVRIDSCGHTFCRECLRGYITALLNEHRSPILCPACTTTIGKGKGKFGGTYHFQMVTCVVSCDVSLVVSQLLAVNLGLELTDKQLSTWTEVTMNPPLPQRRATINLTPSYPRVLLQSIQGAAPPDVDSILYAMHLQREFDKEDRALSAQRIELVNSAQPLFECCICMEEMPMDSIARIDSCGHTFCRECLRGHVTARLDEHRFPILCPTCTANKSEGTEKPGGNVSLPDIHSNDALRDFCSEVSQSLALNLGLTDQQFSVWTEMEMVAFSILLRCRGYVRGAQAPTSRVDSRNRCQRSMFVARDELEGVNIIVCPLPDCYHAWCKLCQQSIDSSGPNHSCDGTLELHHLMRKEGWKYCPSESA